MNRLSRTHILATAVGGTVVILLWALSGCSGLGPTPLDSPLATPTPDLLATKGAIRQATRSIPTAVPGAKDTARAMVTNEAATASVYTPQPTVFPTVPRRTPAGAGTISEGVGPFSPISYIIENHWYEDTEGGSMRTNVWAGAVSQAGGGASAKGVVLVEVHRRYLDGNVTKTELVDSVKRFTPCQGGPVHVTGAVGEVLTLQSTSGNIFYFDVASRQYVPSLGVTATPTPDPNSDTWTFTGDAIDPGTGDPPPCSDITLYQQDGNTWQAVAQTTPSADGMFTLRTTGPRTPRRFLISVQYPPGFEPALPVAGPGFVVVDNNTIMSVPALGPGNYGGHRLRSTHAAPPQGTRTPPPLPTPPPGTWTPPPPTIVSPLATPTP